LDAFLGVEIKNLMTTQQKHFQYSEIPNPGKLGR